MHTYQQVEDHLRQCFVLYFNELYRGRTKPEIDSHEHISFVRCWVAGAFSIFPGHLPETAEVSEHIERLATKQAEDNFQPGGVWW